MVVIVFGASGGTGREVVRQALRDGHTVRAVVRDPAKLTMEHAALEVCTADVFDPVAVRPLLDGVDVIISALGARSRKDTDEVCTRAVRSMLTAMESTSVRRIVAVSAQPVLRSGVGEPLWFRWTVTPLVRAVYRNNYADLGKMERLLADSDVDWTVLRPPYLTDGPGSGRYRTALEANITGASLPRADLAAALLAAAGDETTLRHAVGVAGP